MSRKPQAEILGVGCLCSLGLNFSECVQGLFAPEQHWAVPQPPRRFTTQHPRTYPVFELDSATLDSLPGGDDLLLTARLALAAGLEALEDAGLNAPDSLKETRVGVCVGTSVGSAMNNEAFYRDYRLGSPEAPEPPDMAVIRRYLRSNPAEVLACEVKRLGALPGPVQTVCNACSSGADAIALAGSWINSGLCDLALAGGADELCRVTCNGFISLMIHSQHPARPFDVSRDGLNLGEGAAMLLLAAEGRTSQPKGRLLAGGLRCDAYHLTAPHPEGRGLAAALDEALDTAGLAAEDIAFVNVHGTGTRDNDRVEAHVLASRLPKPPFFSSKGRTGHTLGAAGAIEAALSLGCLQQGRIPSSAGCKTPDPELAAHPVLRPQPIQGCAALSFSLAFGGSNAVLAFGL